MRKNIPCKWLRPAHSSATAHPDSCRQQAADLVISPVSLVSSWSPVLPTTTYEARRRQLRPTHMHAAYSAQTQAHQEGIDVLAGVYGYAPAEVAVKGLLPEAARRLVRQQLGQALQRTPSPSAVLARASARLHRLHCKSIGWACKETLPHCIDCCVP